MENTIIMIVSFIVSIISIITPIMKLNSNLTRLNMTIVSLTESMNDILVTVKNHEKRILYLENNWKSGGKDGNYNT